MLQCSDIVYPLNFAVSVTRGKLWSFKLVGNVGEGFVDVARDFFKNLIWISIKSGKKWLKLERAEGTWLNIGRF